MPGEYNKVPKREEIKIGALVQIAEKINYENGVITKGIVKKILTSKSDHPRGIKVMLTSGKVGRVQALNNNKIIPLTTNQQVFKQIRQSDLPNPDDLI